MRAVSSRNPAYQASHHKVEDVARRRHVARPPSQTAGARISRVWVACVMGHGSPTGSHRIALMQGMQTPPECCGQVPALASLGDL